MCGGYVKLSSNHIASKSPPQESKILSISGRRFVSRRVKKACSLRHCTRCSSLREGGGCGVGIDAVEAIVEAAFGVLGTFWDPLAEAFKVSLPQVCRGRLDIVYFMAYCTSPCCKNSTAQAVHVHAMQSAGLEGRSFGLIGYGAMCPSYPGVFVESTGRTLAHLCSLPGMNRQMRECKPRVWFACDL